MQEAKQAGSRRSEGGIRKLEIERGRRQEYFEPPTPPSVALQRPLASPQRKPERERASVALVNLRGLAIAFVLMVHSSLAYVVSAPAHPLPFNRAPYEWLAFPILDPSRWLGFDMFCAWQDVYLMSLWFFLAGVFVWPSIERDGALRFLTRRILRLGGPLLFGVTVLMPVALYPVYLMRASDPSLASYAHDYLALPFAPCGPLWFLWLLLAFTLATAALHHSMRRGVLRIGELSRRFEEGPARAFAAWALICAAAYVPLALLFTPWTWFTHGPIAIQLCRPLLYAVYYCAGLGVGTLGLGKAILRADGAVARKWAIWMAAAVASLALWMGLTALALNLGPSAPLLLGAASDVSFAVAGACSVVSILTVCLRFGSARRWPLLSELSDNAYSLYVLHYAPVVWLQFALLGLAWPAPVKAAFVLLGATASCMAGVAGARLLRQSVIARLSLR